MKDFGYDVDHRDIDPIFGTLEDFDRLIEQALLETYEYDRFCAQSHRRQSSMVFGREKQ